MTSSERPFPEAQPHGSFEEVFSDVFIIKGTVTLTRGVPMAMSFSRNMTVVRNKDTKNLVLLNSVRLNDEGLAELDKLGTVTDVIRCAGFHGMDDAFYKDRYPNATIWSPAPYVDGFEKDAPPYFTADKMLEPDTQLPIKDSQLVLIQSADPLEALVLMEHETAGKILVTGDSLQNWSKPDEYFGWVSSFMMRFMGFIKPFNVGPAWYQTVKPDKNELAKLLDLKFDHVLPSHGEPCVGKAFEKYEPAIKGLK